MGSHFQKRRISAMLAKSTYVLRSMGGATILVHTFLKPCLAITLCWTANRPSRAASRIHVPCQGSWLPFSRRPDGRGHLAAASRCCGDTWRHCGASALGGMPPGHLLPISCAHLWVPLSCGAIADFDCFQLVALFAGVHHDAVASVEVLPASDGIPAFEARLRRKLRSPFVTVGVLHRDLVRGNGRDRALQVWSAAMRQARQCCKSQEQRHHPRLLLHRVPPVIGDACPSRGRRFHLSRSSPRPAPPVAPRVLSG